MKRLSLLLVGIAWACVSWAASSSDSSVPRAVLDSVQFEGQTRYYYIYIPSKLLPQKPLVLMTHGYGGKAEGYRPEMLEVAEREGFALCIPQGLKAPNGKTGWYVGYPKQVGMKENDDEFLCWLAAELCRRHGLNADNKFFTGMSNGGEMCYLIARSHPGVFNAIASIAGLTMKWIDESFPLKAPVPFMEVHGTADKTSMWEGDLSNSGGWGAYIAVPDAVQKMVSVDGCKYLIHEYLPPLKEDSRAVVLHRWTSGVPAWKGGPECEVRLYEIRGGKHSWGLSDMDTCNEVWRFFKKYLR